MSDVQIREVDESDIDTVLAGDIEFEGTLNFEKSLMIKGQFLGDIKAAGELYIDTDAYVEARVEAEVVSLKGKVKGDVFAYSRVELFASAMVDGDITAPDVIMESGCRFNGICRMESPLKEDKTGDAKRQGPVISRKEDKTGDAKRQGPVISRKEDKTGDAKRQGPVISRKEDKTGDAKRLEPVISRKGAE